MAGVRPEGGYGRIVCVVFSAVALQLMSSLLNFGGLSTLAVAALIGAALKYTPPGRWLMLSGSNPLAALYAGFPRTGVVTATYALSGTLSACRASSSPPAT